MNPYQKLGKHNSRQADFVWHYVNGEDGVRGNGAAAYLAAGYTPKTRRIAANAAGQLLRDRKLVKDAARYLQNAREEVKIKEYESWQEMLPSARRVIAEVLDTPQKKQTTVDRMRYDAALHVVDRCEGKPRQSLNVSGAMSITPVMLELSEEDDEVSIEGG